ncbi:sodium/proline symporter [Rothia halotolerans]|uniref:sodium/proline symporter n=1 Tax=Rothia halotolerans TaxID=405770 RepID=UPI00101CDA8E|nr:sodium/proline symporter [Rothia halotolerans]
MTTSTDPSTIVIFVLYIVLILGIGVWAYRKNTGMSDFAIGGRRLGTFVTTVSAKATDSSQWVFFGLPGAFYVSGVVNAWMVIGLTLGFYLSWKILAGRLRDYSERSMDWRDDAAGESVTLPGFFANRFHSDTLRSASAVFIIIFYVVYLGSAFIATGVIFSQVFGTSVTTGTIVGAVAVMAYSSMGGYLASSYTDLIQGLLMFVSLAIVMVVALVNAGGFGGISDALIRHDADMGNLFAQVALVDGQWHTTSTFAIVAIVSSLAWGLGYFGSPHILVRFMGMRSKDSAKNGARLGLILSITLLGSAGVIGMAAVASFGNAMEPDPEGIYMHYVSTMLPTWMAGIFLAGVLSAIMSTASSQLVVASTTLTEDFYRAFLNREASPKRLVWLSRVTVVLCTIVGVVVALNGGTILDLVGYAWAGFGATFGPVLLAALYSRRATWVGALASIIAGGATVIVYRQIDQIGLYELVPGFIVGLIALWIGNRFGPAPSERVTRHFDGLTGRIDVVPAAR